MTFGRPGQPTDQAITERSHQTWARQVLAGQTFASQAGLWHILNERRAFLNHELPCAPLGDMPPLVAHPEAATPRRVYRPEWEVELLNLDRVYAYLGQCRWFRQGSSAGTISLGSRVYVLGKDWRRAEVEITFDPADQHLVCQAPDGRTKRLPARGLTAQELGGDLTLAHLQPFQLALPLSWPEWRSLQSCQMLSGTTL